MHFDRKFSAKNEGKMWQYKISIQLQNSILRSCMNHWLVIILKINAIELSTFSDEYITYHFRILVTLRIAQSKTLSLLSFEFPEGNWQRLIIICLKSCFYTSTKSLRGYISLQFVCVSGSLLLNKIDAKLMHQYGCGFR